MRRLILVALIALPSMASAQILGGVGSTVGHATGAATDAVSNATAPVTQAATHEAKDAAGGKAVTVKAGARVRVGRETRCYDGADYYDPTYRPDGYYYCETRGPGLAADASVQPH